MFPFSKLRVYGIGAIPQVFAHDSKQLVVAGLLTKKESLLQ